MSDVAVTVDRVYKKFRRGELHDSLRDAIPAFTRRLLRGRPAEDALSAQEFWALQDVSFELKRGEALGIIGPNGAGKSTLLKTLSRIIRPTMGSYQVNGRLRALIEVAAGFHGDLTGRENVFLNGTILGMSRSEISRKLDQIVDFSGIESFIDTPVKRYSSGMQARLGFSVAAHLDPEILLVDEVLAVGDAVFRAKCLDHMERLLNSDVSVVFISHNLEQVQRLCQRGLVLNKGQVQYEGTTASAVGEYHKLLRETPERNGQTLSRDGAGGVRITRAEVTGVGTGVAGILFTGQPATITIHLDRNVPNLICRLGIINSRGEHVLHFDSARTAPNDENTHSGTASFFQWSCDELPLLPGMFQLAAVIATPDGIDQDRLMCAAQFEVQGNRWHGRFVAAPMPIASVTLYHTWRRSTHAVRENDAESN